MAQSQADELSFTYGQNDKIKINLDSAEKVKEKEESKSKNLENFNKMKSLMGDTEESADFYSNKFSSVSSYNQTDNPKNQLKHKVHDYVGHHNQITSKFPKHSEFESVKMKI